MRKQLFICKEVPSKDLFNPIVQNEYSPLNKALGGLWTSTYVGRKYGSSWVQWMLEEGWGYEEGEKAPAWLLCANMDARIYHIDTYKDLDILMQEYGKPIYKGSDLQVLDFIKLSKDFDAIHLTARGQEATRLSMPYNLYGWDCESTFWLKWKFDLVEWLGEIEFKSVIFD
jgi:hypothetical protein